MQVNPLNKYVNLSILKGSDEGTLQTMFYSEKNIVALKKQLLLVSEHETTD